MKSLVAQMFPIGLCFFTQRSKGLFNKPYLIAELEPPKLLNTVLGIYLLHSGPAIKQ